MRRNSNIAVILVGLAGLLTWIGCSSLSGTVKPNQEPETTLWVTGDLDTVRHTAQFFWDGQDPDGVVVAFEFKWIYEPGAEPAGHDSTVWVRTEKRDSLFVVFTPNGADFPTFVIRSIDDQGSRDPSPARQSFKFTNEAPIVLLSSTPPDTTFPVATLKWDAFDPDGNINNASYRVWLEGKENDAQIITTTQYTLTPEAFSDSMGALVPGSYKVFVTAIDDGGRMSLPDSFSWYVELPVGNTLLIDDLPSNIAGSFVYDGFYRTELDGRLGAGNYTILDLEFSPRLRSEQDVLETFRFFDNVFWYDEIRPFLSDALPLSDPGIRDHLNNGKNIYLSSTHLVGTDGALGDQFVFDVVGASDLHFNIVANETGFSVRNGEYFIGGSVPFDSVRANGVFGGVEAFDLIDEMEASYLAPPGAIDTNPPDPWPVGVSRRVGSGQGRFVFLAFPLRIMNRAFVSGQTGRSDDELRKVFDLFNM